jgi:hypothetical protein
LLKVVLEQVTFFRRLEKSPPLIGDILAGVLLQALSSRLFQGLLGEENIWGIIIKTHSALFCLHGGFPNLELSCLVLFVRICLISWFVVETGTEL